MAGHFSSLLAEAEAAPALRVPATVLTGFLGSGKTTLLNRLLRQPGLEGTAIIVNEFGAIGIDHELIVHSADDTVLLANGCLCCAVRGDLSEALQRLAARDEPPQRILVETSGLADPSPILRTLAADPALRARFVLAGVACCVDAVLGMGTLDRHPEAVRQVAVADRIFVTKTDLSEHGQAAPALLERLHTLNPLATPYTAREAHAPALEALLRSTPGASDATAGDAAFYRQMGSVSAVDDGAFTQHRDGITSFVLVRDVPLPRAAFSAWLDMVIAMRGTDLLRVKGLVQLAEQPDQPLVLHGVQHLFQPPEFLPAWPGADRRSRIVFITRGIDAQALDQTLDVLVRRHLRRPAPASTTTPASPSIP